MPPGGRIEAEANPPPDNEPSAAHATSPDGNKKKTATATATATSGINAEPTGAGRGPTERGAACISAPGATAASSLLTVTMERGAAEEAPRAVWLGRVAAVMEARGDRDEAVRLYGEAAAELTGEREGASRNGSRDGSGGTASSCPSATGKGRSTQLGDGDCGGGAGAGPDLFPYSARAHYLASIIERTYRRHFLRHVTFPSGTELRRQCATRTFSTTTLFCRPGLPSTVQQQERKIREQPTTLTMPNHAQRPARETDEPPPRLSPPLRSVGTWPASAPGRTEFTGAARPRSWRGLGADGCTGWASRLRSFKRSCEGPTEGARLEILGS